MTYQAKSGHEFAKQMRVVRCRNRLPREVVDAPFLELIKARLDGALKGVPAHNRGLELEGLYSFFQLLCYDSMNTTFKIILTGSL